MDLCFDVSNQMVTRTEKNRIVNYSDDYLRLVFSFKTSDWSGCSKFILVFDGEDTYRIALVDDAFIVPEELLTKEKLLFSIYGVNNSYRITTPKILVRLQEAGYSANVKSLDVDEFTHDVVEEVYIAIDKKADKSTTYTKTEVDALIYGLNNKLLLDSDKDIIQTDDTVEFRAYLMKDGMPVKNATIEFYKNGDDD